MTQGPSKSSTHKRICAMFQLLPYLGMLGTAVAGTQVIVGSETVAGSFTTYALGPRLGLTAEAVAAEPRLPRSWQVRLAATSTSFSPFFSRISPLHPVLPRRGPRSAWRPC